MQDTLTLAGLCILAFIINIPCGYLRENYEKFSLMWFVLIHITIPVIVFLRVKTGFGFQIIPLTLTGAIAGQIIGGKVNRRRKNVTATKR